MNQRTTWLFFLTATVGVASGLLGACATPSPRPTPVPPPFPIAFEAQARLLQDARDLLARGDWRGATRVLTRLVETYPGSTLLPEARWLLARCYEQAGRLPRAMDEYEMLAQAPGSPYSAEAVRRMAELRLQPQAGSPAPSAAVINGLLLRDPAPLTGRQFERLAAAGVTVVILPVGTVEGVSFQTTLASVAEDKLATMTSAAHRHGIQVFGALSLDQMEWISRSLGWHDLRYDAARRRLEPSTRLDLFNPGFQEYLLAFVGDLARSGVDGLLLHSSPARLDEGFSPFAMEAFRREFQVTLDPATVAMWMRQNTHHNSAEPAPVFWQWVGWKSRNRAKLLDRLMDASHRVAPELRIAIELHSESVTEPVKALAQYAEDLLAIKQASPDYVLFGLNSAMRRNGPTSAAVASSLTKAFLERAADLLGGLEHVWLRSDGPVAAESLDLAAHRSGLPPDIGLILGADP